MYIPHAARAHHATLHASRAGRPGARGPLAALGLAALLALVACGTEPANGGGGGAPPDGAGGSGAGGSGAGGSGAGGSGGHVTAGESWTFLVYMVADNNLEPFGLGDIAEMAQVGSTDAVKLVVQVDRAAGYSADGLGALRDFQSTKRLLVGRGAVEELEDLGELNMGAARSLADFVTWGVQRFPADRYALILWDHGGAWPGFGGDESTRELDVLNLAELSQAIEAGLQAGGLDRFALIGFDACLMATYEVAEALAPYGEYLLASEELEPGHGWDYRSLQLLTREPTTGPRALGEALLDGFAAQAATEGTSATITLSLVDLTELPSLRAAISSASRALAGVVAADATTVGRERNAALRFGEQADPRQSFHMVDLGDLLARLSTSAPATAAAREEVRLALRRVVVGTRAGATTTRATGLAIYFPPNQGLYRADYDQVAGLDDWRGFLRAYFAAGQAGGVVPTFTNPDKVAATALDAAGLSLQGTLAAGTGEGIASATLRYGVIDVAARTAYVVGDAPASYDARVVQGSWDLSLLALTQGAVTGYGYLSLTAVEGGFVAASIPFGYLERAGATVQTVLLRYVFDAEGQVVQANYYLLTEAGPGELTPVAGAQLYPLILSFNVDDPAQAQWGYGTDRPLRATEPFDLAMATLPRGQGVTIYADLSAVDVGGNGDFVFAAGEL